MRNIEEILRTFTNDSLLPKAKPKGVIILSGGMDSVTLLHSAT
ncbi:MAG: hypothetical protein AAB544_00980 [Patescibacteria group bacterium]